jgi:hypothetical protein
VVLGEDDLRVSGPDRERLLEAVSNALASRRLRVVPRAEVEHAERLAGERRWTDGGVVCGQAPPVPAVVARRHHHIVLAYASTRCSTPIDPDTIASRHPRRTGPDECSLAVTFMHAADADADALPPNMEAVVPAQVELAASWIAAAPRLRALPSEESGVLGGLIGTEGEPDPHYFLASGIAANDPWLRVGSTLNERGPAAMRACHDGPNVASFSVRWTIAADGHVTEAAAEPITRDGGDPAAEVRCVVDAVRALAFPCTRSGQPAAATARVCIGQHSRN